jgi:DNA polymerase III sliding clamp (beta) subunit (PCNA family)
VKIKIARSALLPLLADCAEVSNDKSPFPYATCVIIEKFPGGIRCRASNVLQSIVRTSESATADKAGAVMIHAKDALKRVSALDDGEVQIEERPGSVVISQGGARYSLPKYDIETAPPLTVVEPQGGEIGAAAFGALIGRVAPVMGIDESMPSQHGVCVEAKGKGQLVAKAATNAGGALAPMTFDGSILAILPAPAVGHLRKVLARIDGAARIAVVGSAFHVFADGFAYSTLTASADFPPLERVLPKLEGPSIMVDRVAMLAAVKAVNVGDACEFGLRVRPNPGGILLRGQSKDGSECSRVVKCDSTIKSARVRVDQMIKMLEFSTAETVTIWQADGERLLGAAGRGEPMTVGENGDQFAIMPLVFDAIDLATDPAEWT